MTYATDCAVDLESLEPLLCAISVSTDGIDILDPIP